MSCCRVGELIALQWRDVEHEHENEKPVRLTLAASKTKTSRARVFPLTQRAAEIRCVSLLRQVTQLIAPINRATTSAHRAQGILRDRDGGSF